MAEDLASVDEPAFQSYIEGKILLAKSEDLSIKWAAGSSVVFVTVIVGSGLRAAEVSEALNAVGSASDFDGLTATDVTKASVSSVAVAISPSPPPTPSSPATTSTPTPPLPPFPPLPAIDEGPDDDLTGGCITEPCDKGLTGGIIAAIVVLVILVIIAAIIALYFYRRYKAKEGEKAKFPSVSQDSHSALADLSHIQIEAGTRSTSHPASTLTTAKIPKLPPIESDNPEAEHREVKAKLREYEIAFESRNGFKPRKRTEWGDMWPEYERYAALRKMASDKRDSASDAGRDSEAATGSPDVGVTGAPAQRPPVSTPALTHPEV